MTLDNPPLTYSEEGKRKGILYDYVKKILSDLNLSAQIKIKPWKRALSEVEHGQADIIYNAAKNPKREKYLIYTQEVLYNEEYVLFMKVNTQKSYSSSMLSTLKLATQLGYHYGGELQSYLDRKHFAGRKEVKNIATMINLLNKGRVDAFIADKHPALFYLSKMKINDIEMVAEANLPLKYFQSPTYLAVSKKSKLVDLPQKIDQALKKLKNDNYLNKIIHQYTGR
ncbi:substrate-binding periplasmic protein [Piscirickettsia litoralis]|uniref:substrate-binding periplasmic protein n=1 Tax=Piscirickettsia litoralis TaxID=1891921 RepID=UPI001F3A1340|nr:transporter substrate-binding domain-containing protein [Piscirickettsia litoralis]